MKKIIAVLCFSLVITAGLFAYGGGGSFVQVNADYPGLSGGAGLPGTLVQQGGYGYGVTPGGMKIGGFGLGMTDETSTEIHGGFGGLFLGTYSHLGPFSLSLNGLFGIGGIDAPALAYDAYGFAYFTQMEAEVGVIFTRWFHVGAYGGIQTLFYGQNAMSRSSYPVMGIRVGWGHFR